EFSDVQRNAWGRVDAREFHIQPCVVQHLDGNQQRDRARGLRCKRKVDPVVQRLAFIFELSAVRGLPWGAFETTTRFRKYYLLAQGDPSRGLDSGIYRSLLGFQGSVRECPHACVERGILSGNRARLDPAARSRTNLRANGGRVWKLHGLQRASER